jgi:hypothetical protein
MSAMLRTITPTAIPGWDTTPYNLVTDTGGALGSGLGLTNTLPATPPSPGSPGNPDGQGFPALWFTINLAWAGAAPDPTQIMYFNQIGVMSGPATNPSGGAPNPGGVITATVMGIGDTNGTYYSEPVATTTIDLTNALPGQMYWSAPLAQNFSILGTVSNQPGQILQSYYYVALKSTVNYVMYSGRSCTLRNGKVWGSHGGWPEQPGLPPAITADHIYAMGVDLNLVNYVNLGAGPLAPTATLTGQVLRRGELGTPPAELIPQVSLAGRVHRAGAFEGSNNLLVGPVLANPGGLSGGPLWKPAQLCTG